MLSSYAFPLRRDSVATTVVVGAVAIWALHSVIDLYLYSSVYLGNAYEVVLQYVASSLLGMSAFDGGLATALVGMGVHFVVSIVVAGVFVLSAVRVPALGRNVIVWGLLYGLIVFVVLNFIAIPLSAAPKIDPAPSFLLVEVPSHIVTVGLLLGVLVRWSRPAS